MQLPLSCARLYLVVFCAGAITTALSIASGQIAIAEGLPARAAPSGPAGPVSPPPAQQFQGLQADFRGPATGRRPYLNVLLRFADTVGVTPHPASFYDRLLGGEVGGVDHFYREISSGKVGLTGSRTLDWINLPRPTSYYLYSVGSTRNFSMDLYYDALQIVERQVDLSAYYGINFFPNVPDSNNGSNDTVWATINGRPRALPVTVIRPQSALSVTIAHEIGHNWGFDHSADFNTKVDAGYNSPWTPMSAGSKDGVGVEFIAYHKYRAGWLPPSRVRELAPGSTTSLRIERIALPTSDRDALLVRVPIAGACGEYYTVEARRYAGYDVAGGIPGEGVVIHHVDESRFNPASSPPTWEQTAHFISTPAGEGAKPYWRPGQVFRDTTGSRSR